MSVGTNLWKLSLLFHICPKMKTQLPEPLQGMHGHAALWLCRHQRLPGVVEFSLVEKAEFLQWLSEQSLKTGTSFSKAGRDRSRAKGPRSRGQTLGDPIGAGCPSCSSLPRCCPQGLHHDHQGLSSPELRVLGEKCLVRSAQIMLTLC